MFSLFQWEFIGRNSFGVGVEFRGPQRAIGDPFDKDIHFRLRHPAAGRHLEAFVANCLNQQTFLRFAGHNGRAAFAATQDGLSTCQQQSALGLLRPLVALKATRFQQRDNFGSDEGTLFLRHF